MATIVNKVAYVLVRDGVGFNPLLKKDRGHGRQDNLCSCPYCTANPKVPGDNPYGIWDTLATNLSTGETWKCHFPELHGRRLKRNSVMR